MEVFQATHPPETRYVSVRPEDNDRGLKGPHLDRLSSRLLVWCTRTLAAEEFKVCLPYIRRGFARMSWDGYIDNLIAQTKDAAGATHCDKACIIGLDGGASWTTAAHASALQLQGQEGVNIARCLKNKDFTPFMTSGVYAEGVKYQFLREEDGKVVFGKKKDHGAITLQASKTAIVIGHCAEGMQQGNVNKGVAVIADYLESLGM